MNKLFLLLLVSILAASPAFSQKAKVVSAWNYLKYEELDKAKAAIDEATVNETSKDMAKTWCYRGLIYQAIAEKPDVARLMAPNASTEALTAFKKAMELDTKGEFKSDIFPQLGKILAISYNAGVDNYNAKKDYGKAYESFLNVLSVNELLQKYDESVKPDTGAILNTAMSAEKIGKTAEAKAMYEKLAGMNYKDASIYQSLGSMYKAEKDTAAAIAILDKGLAIFPGEKALLIDQLNIYLQSGKMNQAIEKLKLAISHDPTNPDLQFALGTAYDNLKDVENAKLAYAKAIELKPDHFDANYNMGALYFNQAIEMNKQINNLNINQQKEYDDLTKKRNNLFEQALPYFVRAQGVNPNDEANNAAISKIKSITGK